MQTIKTAVVGVGYLGKFHAEKYNNIPNSKLVAVVDANKQVAQEIAQKLDVQALTNYEQLKNKIDAVSIVVPTQLHFDTAKFFLENGIHVLVEKPITTTVEQASILIELAQKNKLVFQVGHLERFNPAILALEDIINKPMFIESHRVAPFNPRGADVNVILDLMIHDIDIIMNMVNSKVTHIDANGVKVLSNDIDIANTRLQFECGCVANVTASRAGLKSERKMRLFQADAYIAIDFQNKKLGVHRKGDGEMHPGVSNIESEEQTFDQGDALFSEIESFLDAIVNKKPPVVSGVDGQLALKTALQITELLKQNN
ncbi:Oxidoreductase, Gfo/Idh/MocA family [hydrothermal vent metagenome]|uniref:Oxidoreductase, Gfo/Idh/MocA family n=1 Tax=hydrothermal vent metagenome TaxID=652676 RepID=A0A3B1AL66_9ZZZZ